MRSLQAAALVLTMSLASPALAQSETDDRFGGFYFGGAVGGTFQDLDDDETILFDRDLNGSFGDTVTTTAGANAFSPGFCAGTVQGPNRPTRGCSVDEQAIEYSARIGFDMQFGSLVAGVLVEGGRTEARSDVTAFSTTPASYTISREIDYMVDVRARLGFAARPSTLAYVTAGASYASLDQDFFTTNTANSNAGSGGDDTTGFVIGGGIEQLVGRNASLGIEYLYRQYDDQDFRVRLGAGTAPATNPFLLGNAGGTDFRRSSDQFNLHSVRLVLNFRY